MWTKLCLKTSDSSFIYFSIQPNPTDYLKCLRLRGKVFCLHAWVCLHCLVLLSCVPLRGHLVSEIFQLLWRLALACRDQEMRIDFGILGRIYHARQSLHTSNRHLDTNIPSKHAPPWKHAIYPHFHSAAGLCTGVGKNDLNSCNILQTNTLPQWPQQITLWSL